MSTSTLPADVEAYLRRVRARLADLPAEEREDLLADVEPSVVDSAGDSDAPVELRLGPPERFADELRAAAGLPPRVDAQPARASLREQLRALAQQLRLGEVAGLWWIAAAYVVLAAASFVGGIGNTRTAFWCAAVAVLVAGAATTLKRRPGRWLSVVLAVGILPLLVALSDGPTTIVGYPVPEPASGLTYGGVPVENVYAFDRRGRLLQDVRLYDATGQPLALNQDDPDPARRVPRTRRGDEAFNAFPVRYFDAGTRRVGHPNAGAPPAPDPLVTPPVK